ncbi:MAG: amidohydrolase family protein, partial [Polyangiales bacterium]
RQMKLVWKKMPQAFEMNPIEQFKRNIYVAPFFEDDLAELIENIGADHVLFGSDYPHPEGLSDPVTFPDHLPPNLPQDDLAKIMGGTLGRLMRAEGSVADAAAAE